MPFAEYTRLATQMADLLKSPARPENDFIVGRMTYQEVYDLACGLKTALDAEEDPDRPVCLFTEDKALTAAAMLAAAAEGSPQLLLPYALNPNVLKDIRATTGARRVITDLPDLLPPTMTPVDAAPRPFPSEGFKAAAADKEIVRLFTGGTTGTPQVWPKTLANLFGEAFFMVTHFNLSPSDCFVANTVPYHIYGLLFAVLVPLAASAGVVAGTSAYPQAITDAIAHNKATVFAGVPMHYRVLNGIPIPGDTLRLAISSAGRLDPDDGAAFYRKTGVGVTEIYGSTETGGVATRNRAKDESTLVPLESVAHRIEGERLFVRSPYLSPNLETDQTGFFRTNDRVSRNGQKGFFLLGRADGIVKVGGKRVDLEGVQTALKGLPGIADALVLARPAGRARENEIVAVVEGAMDVTAIRRALAATVETYALPRRIVAVDKIPMSAAGKYDRETAAQLFATENPSSPE